MKGRRERGGSRMSETKDVTKVVKAAAILFECQLIVSLKLKRGINSVSGVEKRQP
jgi:hypothetical protein